MTGREKLLITLVALEVGQTFAPIWTKGRVRWRASADLLAMR